MIAPKNFFEVFAVQNPQLFLLYLAALLHNLITGLSFLFTKTALKHASPIDVLAFRFTASLLALSIPVVWGRVKLNFRGKNLGQVISLALVYPISFFALQTFGLLYASSSEGGILLAVTPIFTMIMAAIFLKEKTTILQQASIILSVIGVVYIFIMKGAGLDLAEILGISLLLLSALTSAGYHILTRVTIRQFSATEISFMMTLLGFLFFNTFSLIGHALNNSIGHLFALFGNMEFVLSVLYLGVLSSLVTSLLNNYLLAHMEAAKVSVFGNLRTVVTILAGVYFLKEPLFLYHVAGSLMIILGVIGTNYVRHGPERVPAKKGEHPRP